MAYRNLDLHIFPSADDYTAKLQTEDGATADVRFSLPFEESERERLILDLSPNRDNARRAAKKLGGALYQAVFTGKLAGVFRAARAVAKDRSDKVRIRLRLNDATELAALPWEFLYDKDEDQFLTLL